MTLAISFAPSGEINADAVGSGASPGADRRVFSTLSTRATTSATRVDVFDTTAGIARIRGGPGAAGTVDSRARARARTHSRIRSLRFVAPIKCVWIIRLVEFQLRFNSIRHADQFDAQAAAAFSAAFRLCLRQIILAKSGRVVVMEKLPKDHRTLMKPSYVSGGSALIQSDFFPKSCCNSALMRKRVRS